MKGAGHNFGIVTSVSSEIYNVAYRDWEWQTIIYSGDQNYLFFFNSPHLDPERACPISAFPLASKIIMLKRERRRITYFYLQYNAFSKSLCFPF